MKYSVSALVLGFFATLSVAAPAASPDLDGLDPGQVFIKDVKYGGTGCPATTAEVSFSPNKQTVTIIFDKYEAIIGPGSKINDHIKNCNLNFQIIYPPGYQYTLYKTDYTGYASLAQGVTAKQTSSYWFAGFVGNKPTFQSTWKGYFSDQYTFTDTTASQIYSPCGASTTLNINTQLVLTSTDPKAEGLINTQTIEEKVITKYQHAYGVTWRKCH